MMTSLSTHLDPSDCTPFQEVDISLQNVEIKQFILDVFCVRLYFWFYQLGIRSFSEPIAMSNDVDERSMQPVHRLEKLEGRGISPAVLAMTTQCLSDQC